VGLLACSAKGNHISVIHKVSGNYDELAYGLSDIIDEAKD